MAAGFVFYGGPRDGEIIDELGVLDIAPGPGGGYDENGKHAVVDKSTRAVLQWTPAPGGNRSAPKCKEPCGAGCPANGLAGA